MSGQVTPDSYVVEKTPSRIIERTVQAKSRGLYRSAKGANEWKTISKSKAEKPSLTDAQILELSKLILRIENHYGFPCDIEWAFKKGKFYIVQSRPITTLADVKGEAAHIKFTLIFKEYHPPLWLYFWAGTQYLKYYEKLSGADVGILYKVVNNELTGYMQTDAKEVIYESLSKKIDKKFFDALFSTYKKRMSELRAIKRKIERATVHGGKLSDSALTACADEIHDITGNLYPMSNFLYVLSGEIEEIAKGKLDKLTRNGGSPALSSYLHPAYETKAMGSKKELFLLKKKYFIGKKTIKDEVAGRYRKDCKFRADVQKFAAKYQYLTSLNMGVRDAESFFPDIADVPDSLEKTAVPPQAIRKEMDTLGHIAFFKDEMSTFVVPYVKFALIEFWNQMAARLGISLEDLEQLHIDEMGFLIKMPKKDVMSLVKNRRKFTSYFHLSHSDLQIKEGESAEKDFAELEDQYVEKHDSNQDGVIVGKTGNAGKVTGKVQIIHSASALDEFAGGNILVTSYTAPEFVPIMKKAAGVITDTGGITSHAAIVSRELGIPCVVGAKIATQMLKDGDFVEVDATAGTVRILKTRDESEFEKIYTRDTTYIMQELWAYGCSSGIEKTFGWKNPNLPGIIHHMYEGSIEIWENMKATRWLEDKILETNKKDGRFIDDVLKKYGGKLSVIHALWEKKISIAELKKLIDLSEEAMPYFIAYYYSAVDDRTPKGIREKALAMRNSDEFFAQNDIRIRDSIIAAYPKIQNYETAIFVEELDSIPSLGVLKARRSNSLIVQGKNVFIGSLEDFHGSRPEFVFKEEAIESHGRDEIRGEIAQKGKTTGRVKILRRRDQVDEVVEGDIIVSPMTTPDFLPAMKKAAAFVTDEGGITCHAGIAARELKKPCIIGTKIATQALKDGDFVEVDANAGVVKILEKKEGLGGPKNLRELRPTVKRDLSLFSVEAWQAGYTKYFEEDLGWWYDVIFHHDGEKVNFYHTKDDFAYFKETVTARLMKDDALFGRLDKKFRVNVRRLKKELTRVNAKNIPVIFDLAGKIMSFYVFVVSDAFVKARPEAWKSRVLSEGVLYEADERVASFLKKKLAGRSNDPSLAHFLRYSEICEMLAGKSFSLTAVAARAKGYILFNDVFLTGVDFPTYCTQNGLMNPEQAMQAEVDTLRGVCAQKGRVCGRTKIVTSRKDFSKVKAGDIVVSIMTNATYLLVLKKSAAFVTDEGGITCHAAIIARELKKPCIIGTKIATQILKDGDLVEVDAVKGIVKIVGAAG